MQKVLEEKKSPINGNIQVIKSLGLGTYIQVDGLTQSGSVVYLVWKKTLKRLKRQKPEIKRVLILGLGGGSVATLVRKYWSESEIVGIEIDRLMVEMGRKYLKLGETKTKVIIKDAKRYLKEAIKGNEAYDLILVDLYIGYEVPKGFRTTRFINGVRKLIKEDGIVVFNRLFSEERRKEALKFSKKLEKQFPSVEYFYPEANVMFICTK